MLEDVNETEDDVLGDLDGELVKDVKASLGIDLVEVDTFEVYAEELKDTLGMVVDVSGLLILEVMLGVALLEELRFDEVLIEDEGLFDDNLLVLGLLDEIGTGDTLLGEGLLDKDLLNEDLLGDALVEEDLLSEAVVDECLLEADFVELLLANFLLEVV